MAFVDDLHYDDSQKPVERCFLTVHAFGLLENLLTNDETSKKTSLGVGASYPLTQLQFTQSCTSCLMHHDLMMTDK